MAWMARRRCAVYPIRDMSSDDNEPRNTILKLLSERDADKTICPSEAARAIGGAHWRDLMPTVHAAARTLADEGVVELRQGGERVGTDGIVGPYQIADRRAN